MRTKLLLLFFALGEITASAQTDSLPNITKTSNGKLIDPIQIHEVVVTGTRNETDIRHLPMTISVIDRKQIEQSMQPSILPILTQQVPGLFITARGIMGYGVSGGAAGGKAQNRYVEGERNGEREHIVDKVQHEIAGYIDFRQDISHWLTLDAGIRIDHHSHIGTEWIPQAGLSFHLPGSIELKASAGKGFRYPTIREMYMFPPKNPDLRPESMWNYELAFAQRLLDGRLSYGINVFYIDGKNLIVAVPRAGATPLNMNTGKIDNTGVEVEAAYRIHPHWSVETNYSYLHMDNPVLGAPEHKFYAGAMFSKNRWTVSTGLQYVANLYTDVDHVQTEDFVLWNINGSFKVTEWFDIWARGENLLAQRYEINAGYPMPKATIMAGINVKF